MVRFTFLILLLFFVSCGSSQDEKVVGAIDRAQTYLSKGKCDEALKELDEARDLENAVYLQVLASAYACKGDVEIVNVITEIQNINTNNVFGELSKKTFAVSDNLNHFNHLKQSLDVILSATPVASQEARDERFGKRKGQDLGMQLLFYSVIQAAKFTNYFGNAAHGKKGDPDGLGSNTCFLNYITDVANFFIIIPPTIPASNACQAAGDGHPDLDLTTITGKANACQGIVAVNNLLDTLDNLDFGDSQELKILKEISNKISGLKATLVALDPSLTHLFNIRDVKKCSELSDREIELFIFAFYELGFE